MTTLERALSAAGHLTPREREVLVALADGPSDAGAARRPWLSEATVTCHVARVLLELGVRNRVQAVAPAYRSGVVPVLGTPAR